MSDIEMHKDRALSMRKVCSKMFSMFYNIATSQEVNLYVSSRGRKK